MQFNFADSRVLVTGGTRGIGGAVVQAFLEAGARVAVNGRTTESVARAVAGAPGAVAAPGDIVNIASESGLLGSANLTVYCASKGGVVNLTRAMALELAPDVRVNCVCPGYVDTDMVRADIIDKADDPAAMEREMIDYAPLKRIAAPVEIAQTVLYLASPAARFATGTALQLDGGTTAGR